VCVYALILLLAYVLEEESLHTPLKRQQQILITKIIVITPVEQSLQPVNYAW